MIEFLIVWLLKLSNKNMRTIRNSWSVMEPIIRFWMRLFSPMALLSFISRNRTTSKTVMNTLTDSHLIMAASPFYEEFNGETAFSHR